VTLASEGGNIDESIVIKNEFPWKDSKSDVKLIEIFSPEDNKLCGIVAIGGLADTNNAMLDFLCSIMQPKICSESVRHTCEILIKSFEIKNYVSFLQNTSLVLQSVLLMETNIYVGVRIALLNNNMAIIFEDDTISDISIDNTLLADTFSDEKPRFIFNCMDYIQSTTNIKTDIFISPRHTVAGIIVFPIKYKNGIIGGIYVTVDRQFDFRMIKDQLTGRIAIIGKLIGQRCAGDVEFINKLVAEFPSKKVMHLSKPNNLTFDMDLRREDQTGAHNTLLAKPRQDNTQAIFNLFNEKIIHDSIAASVIDYEWMKDLHITDVIGKGGFGIIYKGVLNDMTVAVKIMYNQKDNHQLMKEALEIAVLKNMTHPNIVALYAYMVDMVQDDWCNASTFQGMNSSEGRLSTCNMMIMEYCDQGSLSEAIRIGIFQGNMDMIYEVLMEIASAMKYMHSLRLLHCDIKPANILLKSDNSTLKGFVAKLSDFGFSQILLEKDYIINQTGGGTITHLAPEMFQSGSHITYSVDVYAFGILMWEIYTGNRLFYSMGPDSIDHVYRSSGRPKFPEDSPRSYRDLAEQCWSDNAAVRPTFDKIMEFFRSSNVSRRTSKDVKTSIRMRSTECV
jgi:hypothetical protein